jgi:glycine/D-amino acid oxidase-like deaminating enzyme
VRARADVVVIGAGIVGCSAARYLTLGIFGEFAGATATHEPLYDPKGDRLRV